MFLKGFDFCKVKIRTFHIVSSPHFHYANQFQSYKALDHGCLHAIAVAAHDDLLLILTERSYFAS